jgi:hypothetical protein
MIKHEITIQVNRPVEAVFAFVTDGHNLAKWQADLMEHESLTSEPPCVGSRFREVRQIRGRPTEIRAHITEFEVNRRFATQTETFPQVNVSYSIQPENSGTRINYEFVMKASGLMRLIEPMISGSIIKGSKADLEKLKHVLES